MKRGSPHSSLFWSILALTAIDGLKLKELQVPSYVGINDEPTFSCLFDLNGGRLQSVKWYKDEHEFCRYTPANHPTSLTFPLPGIALKRPGCDMHSVWFSDVSWATGGSYKCEVSLEGPTFFTVSSSRNITVLTYPLKDPVITGVQPRYKEGEHVYANCSSLPSYPPPVITWFINDVEAESWMVYNYPVVKTNQNLYWTASTLRFQTNKYYFHGPNSEVHLKCISKVSGLIPWVAVISPRMEERNSTFEFFRTSINKSGSL